MTSPNTIEFTLSSGNRRLLVSNWGASLRDYYLLNADGTRRNILWGYSGTANKKGGQGDVLIPFPGRIRQGEYRFEGRHYQLERNDKEGPNAIHGFVRGVLWEIEEQKADSVCFRYDLPESRIPGYPFALETKVRYELTSRGLEIQYRIRNRGTTAAPVGAGFHPYFTVGTPTIDEAELRVPASELVEFDAGKLPTGRVIAVDDGTLDFRALRKIGATPFNHCYASLIRDADGLARARLRNPATCDEVTVWMDEGFSYLVIYSGDALGGDARRSLAIEPMSCATDAFNRPEWGLRVLGAGESVGGRFGIEASGSGPD